MDDLISIIMPIYNVERYIRKSLESIYAQTYQNLEIIMVDDGSTDNSGKICDEFANKDSRFKVIHQINQGVSGARNTGLQNAKGRYIGFVDPDDYIENDMYEKMIGVIKRTDADIVVCRFDDDGIERELSVDTGDFIQYNSEKWLSNIFNTTDAMGEVVIVLWNKLYKREAIEDVVFPKGRINEDLYAAIDVAEKDLKIILYHKTLYHYVHREKSIMKNKYSKKRLDGVYANKKLFMYFKNRDNLEISKIAWLNYNNSIIKNWDAVILSDLSESEKNLIVLELKNLFLVNLKDKPKFDYLKKNMIKLQLIKVFGNLYFIYMQKKGSWCLLDLEAKELY